MIGASRTLIEVDLGVFTADRARCDGCGAAALWFYWTDVDGNEGGRHERGWWRCRYCGRRESPQRWEYVFMDKPSTN